MAPRAVGDLGAGHDFSADPGEAHRPGFSQGVQAAFPPCAGQDQYGCLKKVHRHYHWVCLQSHGNLDSTDRYTGTAEILGHSE